MSLYEERLKRTLDAIHMKKVDKIPFSYSGPAYMARAQGYNMTEFTTDFDKAADAAVGFCLDHSGIDSLHSPQFSPYAVSVLWLSQVKRPGYELGDDELWQLDEKELMTLDDYEIIVRDGYGPWLANFMHTKLDDPLEKMASFIAAAPNTFGRCAMEAQVPVMNAATACAPIEAFCGARQMTNFFFDLMDEPELVKAAMDKAFEFSYAGYVGQLEALHPLGAWVGGWRAAPQLMNHDMFMEFVWPYLKKLVEVTAEHGTIPILHFDSCWDSELETLLELPERTCLLMTDSSTDLRKARNILGDHMAIMGDVPATMLAFGTPDEVYDYTTKLIDDVGPETGLIVSSGCDCPLNANAECVDAMIQATIDYRIA
ncbi:MAG: uroporphyrinogen-III decarboxylase [Actinobacteria bacterium]|nr:uroporphyrinogen-III decarboxylase [Actinomycetota bacterium]